MLLPIYNNKTPLKLTISRKLNLERVAIPLTPPEHNFIIFEQPVIACNPHYHRAEQK